MLRLAIAALCLALCVALAWSQDRDAPERDQQPSSGGPGSPQGPNAPAGPQGMDGAPLPAAEPPGPGGPPVDPSHPTAAAGEPGGRNGDPAGSGSEGGTEGARHGKDDLPNDGPALGDVGHVTDDDARESIGQVVENFVANHSVDGAWRIVDKKTKKPRLLKLVAVHEKKIVKKDDALYSVPVLFKDLASGQTVKTVFTVDFTPPEWKVVAAHLLR